MATRWVSRVAVTAAVVGAVTIAGASAAWADPGGNNGTVKIQMQDVDGIANDPHVPCDFQVAFFGFDEGQEATITFTIHPPSGGGGDVLLSETQTVSDDAAGGGLNDPDAVFVYSGTDDFVGLFNFFAQPQQGFHVKLTIESAGVPGGKKHKVFWLQCVPTSPSPSPSKTPPPTTTQPPSTTQPPATTPAAEALPVTGLGLAGLIATGVALVGGGAALLFLRRRRAASEGTAEL